MKLTRLVCVVSLVAATTASSFAFIITSYQMVLGNPSGAGSGASNYLIQRPQYALGYVSSSGIPKWVAWSLSSGDQGSGRYDGNFITDTSLPAGMKRVTHADYTNSGFDRGHMSPNADRNITLDHAKQTFLLTNIQPQRPDNNQGIWANFETYCRNLTNSTGREVLIMSGGYGSAGTIGTNSVTVPTYNWKIAILVPAGSGSPITRINANPSAARVIALRVPNVAGIRTTPWTNYITTASSLQGSTGLSFFTALNSAARTTLLNDQDTGTN
ncbi:DNA/RNA non-specific endonuclease [Oleiharenicola lentus]|uniref:DNA/RNA non-specific endonuclease n=1 Tax=Oleiharenicola lentus TaxID=2508720 RepID=UPI003F66F743